MTTVDDLRASIVASLTFQNMLRSAARPEGLTASAVGGCPARAGYVLRGDTPTDSGDPWAGLRGTYIGEGIEKDRAAYDPTLVHQRRVDIEVAGITISGALDEMGEDYIADWKTRSIDDCYYHANHGPDPQHAMQVALLATACGKPNAFVVYAPISGTFEDFAICAVDVRNWFAEAQLWIHTVRDNLHDREHLPRTPPSSWCSRFCGHFTDCRGGFITPDEELTDEWLRDAMGRAYQAKQEKSSAEKRQKAAMAVLEGVTTGRAGALYMTSNYVDPTETRRGYWRREIKSGSVANAAEVPA